MSVKRVKKEARVAYIACREGCCCAVVLRGGELIDWAGCAEASHIADLLCSSSVAGETRMAARCGDAPLPHCMLEVGDAEGCRMASSLVERILRLGGGCVEGSA